MKNRRLFVIGENQNDSRALAHAMRLLCRVDYKPLDRGLILFEKIPPDMVVLGDVSFDDTTTIRRVQRALRPFLEVKVPVICLLDQPTRRDTVQALSVGATAVLPSDTPMREVFDTIRTLLNESNGEGLFEGKAEPIFGFEQACLSLADLFRAGAAGRRVEPDVAGEAAGLLLEAIDSTGIKSWMEAVRHLHDWTYRHSLLMAGVMAGFALKLGFRSDDCHSLVTAALLHDIGKALIPIELIDKPSALTSEEMDVMRQHAALGHGMLVAQGNHHELTLMIARSHHEALDGSGYPDGLTADRIPDQVRMATICDVFSALVEERVYKEAMPPAAALDLMDTMTHQLDPDLLAVFRTVFGR